jgi:tetratricopeptide (TPR) repeat protein
MSKAVSGGAAPEGGATSKQAFFAGALALAALTLCAYAPALRGGFIWDDDTWITGNRLLWEPGGLWRIWFTTDSPSQYFPLTSTLFRIQYSLWGADPFGYHAVNVLLHAGNAILAWRLLRRLALPGGWLAAAAFALHPVQVESVAWITELKNVLSTAFYLLAVLFWLRFDEGQGPARRRWYALSLLAFALALLSKTTAVTLPPVLLLLAWYRARGPLPRQLPLLAPYAALGLAMGLMTIWWERTHQGAGSELLDFPLLDRLLIAGRALWFYLGKLAWPAPLTFSYPRWQIDAGDPRHYLGPAAALCAAAALWRHRRALGGGPALAGAFFAVTLAPMLGFVSLYTFLFSFVADHYQYLACLGPLALAAGLLAALRGRPRFRSASTAVAAAVLVAFGAATWNRTHAYRDRETLWRDTLAKNGQSWLAMTNLADELFAQKRYAEAKAYYERSLVLWPTSVEVLRNLGLICAREGDLGTATRIYVSLVRLGCPGHSTQLLEEIKRASSAGSPAAGAP